VIASRATLDVPGGLAQFAAGLLLAGRRRRGTPRGGRALTCFWQAVLGLRWFRGRTAADALARDHGISRATAYRYLDEASRYSRSRLLSCTRCCNGPRMRDSRPLSSMARSSPLTGARRRPSA
jgi:hypothetical protein